MSFDDKDVVIIDGVRSPMCRSKGGGFKNVRAENLSAVACQFRRAHKQSVDYVVLP